MENFRDELRIIMNNNKWSNDEKFEAIDELYEKYVTNNNKHMWKIKNNDEYCVTAPSRKKAVIKFKTDLGIEVKPYMLEKI